jgi:ornithine carbamoyltransferase
MTKHFLSLLDLTSEELIGIVRRATELKRMQHRSDNHAPLKGKSLGMIFEKSSTRTRVSFEVGMSQLGGHALFLSPRDM